MPCRCPTFSLKPALPRRRVQLTTSGTYDHQWRKLRDRRIQAEPLCRHCSDKCLVTPAVEVDHIIPKVLGGRDEWDNTQSLCKACHVEKTRTDQSSRLL